MVVKARLFCSDDECDAVYEAIGPIEELEALACACGGGLEVTGFPDEAGELSPNGNGHRGRGFELLPLAA